MLEVLIHDKCQHPSNELSLPRFCYQIMGYCFEPATVQRHGNRVTELTTCLFETCEEILSEVGAELHSDEQDELLKLWTEDGYPRVYEIEGDLLRIRQFGPAPSDS